MFQSTQKIQGLSAWGQGADPWGQRLRCHAQGHGGRTAVTYSSATASAWVLLTPLRFVGECFGGVPFCKWFLALGSTQAHLCMKQRYCTYHKKDSTVKKGFIVIFMVFSSIQFIFLTDRLINFCFYLAGFEWGFNYMPCSEENFYRHVNGTSKKNPHEKQWQGKKINTTPSSEGF